MGATISSTPLFCPSADLPGAAELITVIFIEVPRRLRKVTTTS
jgi:hypothetical protein